MNCGVCGCDPEERTRLLTVLLAADQLLQEGSKDDNNEAIVAATKVLIEKVNLAKEAMRHEEGSQENAVQ